MMKLIVNILYVIAVAIMWFVAAILSAIGLLFASRPIFGGNTGGRTEVIQMLSVSFIVFVLTLVAILLLARANRKLEAMTILVSGLLLGGYFLFIMAAFGAFQYL